ncbi:MAG: FMN-binding negative transcriptional regulator [Thiohalocapsa sp.]
MVYLPPLFTETRPEILAAHIERYDFGLLVTDGSGNGRAGGGMAGGEMTASQIPFLLERRDGRLYLQGHVAHANPLAAALSPARPALAIFQGPHAYISPSWYEAGPAVPTWNYASVHAYGEARAIDDPDWLRDLVERLSERHEAREPQPHWQMRHLPDDYVAMMLRGIVGVELAVERLDGKFKLSQNRPAGDRPRIIDALERRGDAESQAVAQLMRERERRG